MIKDKSKLIILRDFNEDWRKCMIQDAQKGQMLMVVILVMVVALTVSLSVAARSVTNLRSSSEEENSERAFSAAEAGIEQSIGKINGVSGGFANNATYTTKISNLSGISFLLNNSSPILKDDAVDVWLSTYPTYTNPSNGNMTVYWGQASDSCKTSEANNSMAAIELILLTGTKATPKITHFAMDPCQPRSVSNNFEFIAPGGGNISGKTFAYKKTITFASGLIVRIIPLYAPTVIGVTGCDGNNNNCNPLPPQGTIVEAVGVSDNTQRKIVSLQSYPKLPVELFSYTLFSPK